MTINSISWNEEELTLIYDYINGQGMDNLEELIFVLDKPISVVKAKIRRVKIIHELKSERFWNSYKVTGNIVALIFLILYSRYYFEDAISLFELLLTSGIIGLFWFILPLFLIFNIFFGNTISIPDGLALFFISATSFTISSMLNKKKETAEISKKKKSKIKVAHIFESKLDSSPFIISKLLGLIWLICLIVYIIFQFV